MSKLKLYTVHLYRQILAAWRHRRMYSTRREAWRAFGLRLASIRSLRRLVTPGQSTLRLHGVEQPLCVRRATSDYWVLEEIYENGEYAAVRKLNLPDDAAMVDLGANIGLASRYLAELLPRCRIIAIEPDSDNCRMIADNCRDLIQNGRLQVVTAFAAASAGPAAIDRSFDSYGFAKVPANGRPPQELIDCLTLESIMERLGSAHVDLLKCDIEGSEAELFASCRPWIQRIRNMVIETHAPYSLPALFSDLRSAGWNFDIVWQDEKHDRSLALLKQRRDPDREEARV
jgi:FkbM family methyltransferase